MSALAVGRVASEAVGADEESVENSGSYCAPKFLEIIFAASTTLTATVLIISFFIGSNILMACPH